MVLQLQLIMKKTLCTSSLFVYGNSLDTHQHVHKVLSLTTNRNPAEAAPTIIMASASATEAAATGSSSSANGASGGDGETAGTTLPLFATRKAEVMVRTQSTALTRMVGVGAAHWLIVWVLCR